VSTSDPILYPAPATTLEGLRQEAARSRADLARTIEELAERVSPRRLARPAHTVPVAGGVAAGGAVFAVLRQIRALRELAWVGGLGAAIVTFVLARAVATRGGSPRPAGQVARARVTGEVDVVTVLLDQHRRIEAAFAEVLRAQGHDRLEAFASLVELIRHHEHVEQDSVHPTLKSFAPEVAEARLAEEEAADRALASLISAGVHDPSFDSGLRRLQQMVHDHASREESREFPLLRAHLGAVRRREMAGQVRWSP
jgi:hemerythrin superfamily protein